MSTCPLGIDGIAIRPALSTFGESSGPMSAAWITAPSSFGGTGLYPNPEVPTLGNANFSLTVAQMPGDTCGFVIADASSPPWTLPAPFSVNALLPPGAQLLSIQVALPFGGGGCLVIGTASAPLPIPNVPSLAGLDLFAQVFSVDANGTWSASAGLQVTPY